MAAPRPERCQRPEPFAVADHDERPALAVLGAVRPPPRFEDGVERRPPRAAGRRTRAPLAWRGRRRGRSSVGLRRLDDGCGGRGAHAGRRGGAASGPRRAPRRGSRGAPARAAAPRAWPRRPARPRPGSAVRRATPPGTGRRRARNSANSYSHEWWPPCTTRVSVTALGQRGAAGLGEAREVVEREHVVLVAVDEQDRGRDGPDGLGRAHARHGVPAGAKVDARRQPGERPRHGPGDRQVGQPEGLAGEAVRAGGRRHARRRRRCPGRARPRRGCRPRRSSGRTGPRL